MSDSPDIVILRRGVETAVLKRLVGEYFENMVKYVVDVRRRVIALGGELHADAEHLLLEDGSQQADLWGANYYVGLGPDRCIEYTALINIRPGQGNRSMEIADPEIRDAIRDITFKLVGRGEEI